MTRIGLMLIFAFVAATVGALLSRKYFEGERRVGMRKRAIGELEEIAGRTAALSGVLHQFEMVGSRDFKEVSPDQIVQSIQEHVENLYGMVQRVALILAEEWEAME